MKSPTGAMELTITKRKVMVSVRAMRQQRQPTFRNGISGVEFNLRRSISKKLSITLQQAGVLI
jgi:hypothetical protein